MGASTAKSSKGFTTVAGGHGCNGLCIIGVLSAVWIDDECTIYVTIGNSARGKSQGVLSFNVISLLYY